MEELYTAQKYYDRHIKQKQLHNQCRIRVEWQRRKNQDAGGKLITINF